MADEVPNRTDVLLHFLGERQCLTHQTRGLWNEHYVYNTTHARWASSCIKMTLSLTPEVWTPNIDISTR